MSRLLPRLGSTRAIGVSLLSLAAGVVVLCNGADAVAQTHAARNAATLPAPPVATQPGPHAAPSLPIARFETSAEWTTRTADTLYVKVTLSEPARGTVRVPFTVSGTATPGVDFKIDSSTVVIGNGETSGEIVVEVLGKSGGDSTDSLMLTLAPTTSLGGPGSAPGGALVMGHGSHTIGFGPKQLGDPIDGLTKDELSAFGRGKIIFEKRFTPSEGLGPFYNATSCASCHSKPVTGGAADLYRNFYLAVYQFGPTPASQSPSIAPFLSQVVPAFGSGPQHSDALFTLKGGRALLPDTFLGFPVIATQRNSIPTFGVGMFEFVSNATILSRDDPDDLNGDGISGRPNLQFAGTVVGRLGLKAQSNNIELFTRGPLQNQMGITSDPLTGSGGLVSMPRAPFQVAADPNEPTTDNDGIPDPEISPGDLDDLMMFTRFLAPPEPKPFSPDALAGQVLFDQIGCALCHVPTLPSSRGPVNAYSDLLLHNLGPALEDNMKLGGSPVAHTDFRTQPLWGISQFAPYMHDGRAATLLEAVNIHAGEAQASRDNFVGLTETQRDQLIVFLEHL